MSFQNAPSLTQYIQTHHDDWFCVDEYNKRLLEVLSLYCKGDKKFEKIVDKEYMFKDYQSALYLEKGILLIGNVGTGKTELLRMCNRYMKWLGRTGTQFRVDAIPDIADRFSAKGREAFQDIKRGNWMFDELCQLDEKTKLPDKEYAINFGDKILIGAKVVYDRSAIFMEDGWQSHYTTNASLVEMERIYGERVFSRLIEQCNVFMYLGRNRRPHKRPHPVRNLTQQTIKEVPATPIKRPEDDFITPASTKESLQISYEAYNKTGNYYFIHDSEYELLKKFGCEVKELTDFMVVLRAESPMAGDDILIVFAKKQAVADYYAMAKARGEHVLIFPK